MLAGTVNTIEFPNLGIGPLDINRVAFSLFGLDIYWYAVIITAGMLLAILFCMWQAKKVGLSADNVLDIALIGIPTSVIGARLFFVLFTLDQYDSFMEMIDIRDGGMAIYGAVIVAFIAGFFYCRHKKISTLALFDLGSLGFLIGQMIGRWGNFMNAEVYGRETDALFGMTINGRGPFHPTFLYESVWNLVGFIMLLLFLKFLRKHDGEIFSLYFFWYGLGRAFLESLRVEEYVLYLGGIKIDLVLAAVLSACGLLSFIFIRFGLAEKLFGKRKRKKNTYQEVYKPLLDDENSEKTDGVIEENVIKCFNENKDLLIDGAEENEEKYGLENAADTDITAESENSEAAESDSKEEKTDER